VSRALFGWSYPPGVSGLEPEIAGYPDPDVIEKRKVSCPICPFEGEVEVSVWLRTVRGDKDCEGFSTAYQVEDGTFYTCPKCKAEVAK